jgi:hypothetical protein
MSRRAFSAALSAALLAAGAGPALAQADLMTMHQQALSCQIGAPDCEQLRNQVMLSLSEQVEFCTDASCDQARMMLAEQIQLRNCYYGAEECARMQQQMMQEATLPAAGTAPAGAIQPGQGVDFGAAPAN